MGKPTGFMEYDREETTAVEPKERIRNFNEFHIPLSKEKRREQGKMYGLRSAVLPVRHGINGHDIRLPAPQLSTGVE